MKYYKFAVAVAAMIGTTTATTLRDRIRDRRGN